MRVLAHPFALLCALSVALPASALSQTPREIFDRMLAEYERRTENIENYTLIQDAMGFESVLYFEKETVEGHRVFRLKRSSTGGMAMPGTSAEGWDAIQRVAPVLAANSEYRGRDQVGGHAVHVIDMHDLDRVDFGEGMIPKEANFRPLRGTLFVDTEQWVPRRVEFWGEMQTDRGPAEMHSVADLEDYREVDGMLQPFRTTIRVEGMGQAMDPETRAQVEEMKRRLAEMPEAQRAMAEQMMKGQLERLEKMMGGEDDVMTVELVVKEIRVNAGPPRP
ncbi:MAG: hypothetical protein OEO20_12485 [Gemmatimonadota bacterium]|nr:hypothetical protein [Gemmatimonadota bacterium]